VLTGRSTGADNGFTASLSTPLAGGEGLTFVDTDGDGSSGDDAADNVQSAANATLTVNQIPIVSATNNVSDVVPGVTLNLKRADPASTIAIDVERDHSDTVEKVEAFATAYNDLVKFINDQTPSVAAGRTGIGRDPMVRGLRDALRLTIMGAEAGNLSRLPEVGITFDRTGKMVIETDRLTEALESSSTDVQALFAGANGDAGRFGALESLIAGYTAAGGLVANVRDGIDDQVSRLTERLITLESLLAVRRAALQQEFIAADRAMSQLNSQANSLGQLGGQYRLF
jgi:flagellar hook-associated protein 2